MRRLDRSACLRPGRLQIILRSIPQLRSMELPGEAWVWLWGSNRAYSARPSQVAILNSPLDEFAALVVPLTSMEQDTVPSVMFWTLM